MNHLSSSSATLDPPGVIAIVGAGPTGLEAALYGRYLGYDVRLIEAENIAASWSKHREEDLPTLPDAALSPLAKSAVQAQRGGDEPFVLPMKVGEWIDDFLLPLSESDLLRGRVIEDRVVAIDEVPLTPDEPTAIDSDASTTDIESDETNAPVDEIPPDFRLVLKDSDTPVIAEAVILTPADVSEIRSEIHKDAEYFFRIDTSS
ncbi:MAG: hypothetical protein AAF989_14615, partial [Planctomycetota bacterium]